MPGACIARCERLGLGIGRQRAGRIAPAPGQLGADQRQVCVGRALRGGQGGSRFVHTVAQDLHPCQLRHQRRVGGPALERSAQRIGCCGPFALHELHVGLHEPRGQRRGVGGSHLPCQQSARGQQVARLQGHGRIEHIHPCGRGRGARLRQCRTGCGEVARCQGIPHGHQCCRHGLGRQVGHRVGPQRVDPLDAVARLAQHQLDRGLAHFGQRRLVGAYRHRALRVGKLHRAREHGDQRAAVVLHTDVPVGAPDGRRRGRCLQVQAAAIGAFGLRPRTAGIEQQGGHRLRRSGHALDLQHRVLVQAQLGVVREQQRHLGGLPRAHKVALGQGLGQLGRPPVGCGGRTLVTGTLQTDDLGRGTSGHGGLGHQRAGGGCRGHQRGQGRQTECWMGHFFCFRGRRASRHPAPLPGTG